ncbi:MAG: porin, partial [Pseudomonadota bacterium]
MNYLYRRVVFESFIIVFLLVGLWCPAFASPEVSLEERIEKLENFIQEQQQTIQNQQKLLQDQQQLLESLKSEVEMQKEADTKTAQTHQQELHDLKAKAEEQKPSPVVAFRKPKLLNFMGRVQFRYQAMNDNGDDLSMVTNQLAYDDSSNDTFLIRRMRLRFFGDVNDRWSWEVQISADGDVNEDRIDPDIPDYKLLKDEVGVKLQDAYISYKLHPYFNITFGQFKSRFSPSYLTSGPELPLCERPVVIDKLARKREIGISIESRTGGTWDGRGYYKKPPEQLFYYALGIYNGNSFNRMRNDNENMMYTAMVRVSPFTWLHLGASYAYDELGTDEETTILGSPELALFMVEENGQINWEEFYAYRAKNRTVGDDFNILDFNAALDLGKFHLQYEYVFQKGSDTPRTYGYGVEGELDVMDWLNVLPLLKNWCLWEAVKNVQLTWRYDQFDPNVDMDNSFDSQWYTLGCNVFIHDPHLKWQLNY